LQKGSVHKRKNRGKNAKPTNNTGLLKWAVPDLEKKGWGQPVEKHNKKNQKSRKTLKNRKGLKKR